MTYVTSYSGAFTPFHFSVSIFLCHTFFPSAESDAGIKLQSNNIRIALWLDLQLLENQESTIPAHSHYTLTTDFL